MGHLRVLRTLLRVLGLILLGRAAGGQVLPDPLPPSNAVPHGYCPPERLAAGAPAPQQVLNVFLPRGTPPAQGWPVVITTSYGGGSPVGPLTLLRSTGGTAPLRNLVAAGIAVVHFGVPGLGSNSRGLWYPPGHPSGRYESFKPAHDNPEKSAEWAVQWVKVQTLYRFDLTRVALLGSSGGAVLAIRTAMGPERARASGSAQLRASTRVAAIVALQPPTSIWALKQGPELTIPLARHLEQTALPFVAATQLNQVDPELQKDYSLMRCAFQTAEARANNAHQALCLIFGDPVLRIGGAVAPFTLDASGFPVLHDAVLQPFQHDSWFGYVFYKTLRELSPAAAAFHAANSVFAMRDINALAPPLDYHTATYPGAISGMRANKIAHDWLLQRFLGVQPVAALDTRPTPPAGMSAPVTYGCGGNPRDSLFVLPGDPPSGATLVLGLADPAHRQAPGSIPVLALSERPAPGYPCGLATPAGELLIAPRSARFLVGAPWRADGEPATFALTLPSAVGTLGHELYAQGFFLDPRTSTRSSLSAALCLRRAN